MFVKYFTKNIIEQEKLEKYCNSKSEIWRWFFGWRGTKTTLCVIKFLKKFQKRFWERKFFKKVFLKFQERNWEK